MVCLGFEPGAAGWQVHMNGPRIILCYSVQRTLTVGEGSLHSQSQDQNFGYLIFVFQSHSQPCNFYWCQQCSWTLNQRIAGLHHQVFTYGNNRGQPKYVNANNLDCGQSCKCFTILIYDPGVVIQAILQSEQL